VKKYIGKITDDRVMSCSRLAALAGLSSYSTPNDELRKSIAAIDAKSSTAPDSFTSSEPAHWGNLHEGNILNEMIDRLALEDAEIEITEPSVHPTLPLQGSLDGRANGCGLTFTTDASRGIYVIGQDEITLNGTGVLEAKSTRHLAELEPAITRGPLQVQGLMMCTGYQWAAIGVLYQGSELRIFLYSPDHAQQAKIVADVRDFEWRLKHFRNFGDIEYYPALTPNDAALTWERGEPELDLTLNNTLSERVSELHAATLTRLACNDLIKNLTVEIQNEMGNHTVAYAQENGEKFARVTWRNNAPRKEYTVPAKPAKRSGSVQIKILDGDLPCKA
jgi:hypothetical protein